MRRALATLLFAGALVACSSSRLASTCKVDADCREHFRCDAHTHACVCADDFACQQGQVCTKAGYCRVDVGCEDDADCPPGQVCDTGTHNCVESGQCTSDLQCPLGQICDQYGANPSYTCLAACRDTYDCPAHQACATASGQICACPAGTDPASCPVDPSASPDGGAATLAGCSCQAGLCTDTQFCPFGDFCAPNAQDGNKPECSYGSSNDKPFCRACVWAPGAQACGPGANYCLLDTSANGQGDFCGVDCYDQGDAACPSGYFCDYVIILTQWLCHRTDPSDTSSPPNDAECQPRAGNPPCQTDADCPGARCDQTYHQCAGKCVINEGEPSGFCTCVQNSECPKDSCDSTTRTCSLTMKTCDPNDPAACTTGSSQIFCTNVNGTNGCVIGKNCAPKSGLSCADMPH